MPFLGSVPLEPELVQAGDLGRPYMAAFAQSATAEAFRAAIRPLMALDECDQERSCGLIKADNEPTTHPRRIRLGVVLAHDLPR